MSALPAVASPRFASDRSLSVDVKKRYSAGTYSGFQLNVEFTAQPGVTIVLGHSGAGKTTLLRSIAGICDPEQGRISVAGRTLFDSERKIRIQPAKRKVAFVFQDLALFPHLTVYENVAYGLRKLKAEERDRKVAEVLESFQIAGLRKRLPREISGGEQQRVALARSLVTEPSVLLLDEPLSSLDPHAKASIIDDLHTWNETHRIPMLYVTHNHEEVFALGERAISLEQGQILAEGVPMEVVTTPHRQSMAQIASFENLFEAVVIEVQESQNTMTCRLAGSAIEIRMPLTRVTPGASLHVGIRADEILLATSAPAILTPCNLIRGRIKQTDFRGRRAELRVDSGLEFQVHLGEASPESLNLKSGDDAWMIIRPQAFHLIRGKRLRGWQRLFVFLCSRNTSRSPIAEALCNAEIARRMKIPQEALRSTGLQIISAGLAASSGDSMAIEAQEALRRLNVPIPVHRSQNLTAELAARAELIFCMTESQRQTAMKMFPAASSKLLCLQPNLDIEDPHNGGVEGLVRLAKQVQDIMPRLVDHLLAPVETSESA